MAPEQLRGERVDGRCDIYALGILAFELLSGKPPFHSEDYFSLAEMHIRAPLPKLEGGAERIPRWLDSFVRTCAAKQERDRFASASEIADFLGQVLANSPFSRSEV